MKPETIEYFRGREQAEREAVRNASCAEARWAHQQLAASYARLVELEELKAAGVIPPGKVVDFAAALRARDEAKWARSERLAHNSDFPQMSIR
jgi:predicted lysophospholipase L1 biosynthesis ABC-type transport system permease subunit